MKGKEGRFQYTITEYEMKWKRRSWTQPVYRFCLVWSQCEDNRAEPEPRWPEVHPWRGFVVRCSELVHLTELQQTDPLLVLVSRFTDIFETVPHEGLLNKSSRGGITLHQTSQNSFVWAASGGRLSWFDSRPLVICPSVLEQDTGSGQLWSSVWVKVKKCKPFNCNGQTLQQTRGRVGRASVCRERSRKGSSRLLLKQAAPSLSTFFVSSWNLT